MAKELELTEQGDRKRRRDELWLYDDDIRASSSIEDGAVVDFLYEGSFRGRAFYSGKPSVKATVVSSSKTSVDRTFFRKRIKHALEHRLKVYPSRLSYRVINSSGDFIPGLIVDKYGDFLAIQFRHPTIESKKSIVLDVLENVLEPRGIYARNDTSARKKVGLEQYRGLLRGESIPDTVCVQRDPFIVRTDIKSGQKTGYYLDQVENRKRFGEFVDGEKGIDVFCYTGAWGLEALHRGISNLTLVDQSEKALQMARENARLNNWSQRVTTIQEDGFDYLSDLNTDKGELDFIILDPPAFARGTDQLDNALNGYKEINLRAMMNLKPGGLLATSSCSAPVTEQHFRHVLVEGARDAHVTCRILEERGQPPDHPWLPALPSTKYLCSSLCEISLR